MSTTLAPHPLACTDFNLQIPAYAALFMVLLALGWIALFLDRRDAEVPKVRKADV